LSWTEELLVVVVLLVSVVVVTVVRVLVHWVRIVIEVEDDVVRPVVVNVDVLVVVVDMVCADVVVVRTWGSAPSGLVTVVVTVLEHGIPVVDVEVDRLVETNVVIAVVPVLTVLVIEVVVKLVSVDVVALLMEVAIWVSALASWFAIGDPQPVTGSHPVVAE
jgi:hypothetical protein